MMDSALFLRHLRLFCSLFGAVFFFFAASQVRSVLAAPSPEQTVQQMLSRFKQTKKPEIMLEYVHWGKAFQNLPASERQRMGISSPEELRGYFDQFFSDPDRFMREQMGARIRGLPPQQQEVMEQSMRRMVASIQQKRDEMSAKMARTDYSIGEVSVQGNAATVELISSLDGTTKRRKLPLEQIGGRWYLPTMNFISESTGER